MTLLARYKSTRPTYSDNDIAELQADSEGRLIITGDLTLGEFPAAAALADNTANPTTTGAASYIMGYDGTTWDRMPGDSTNGLKTQPATGGSGTVSATTQRVVLATDVALPAGTNLIGKTNRSFNASTTDGFSRDISTALEPSSVTSAAPALLASGFIFIDDTAATDIYYLQFFNSTTVPADTTASTGIISPIIINHTTGTPTKVDFSFLDENGIFFSTGIAWAISTTQFTKTVAGNVATGTIFYKT